MIETRPILLLAILCCFCQFTNGQAPGALTTKEKAAIGKLRPLVENYLTKDYMKADAYLIRWLKANKFDLSATTEKLKQLNRWRKKNNIENILSENLESHQRYLPIVLDGVTKDGLVVLQLYIGKWQMRKYAVAGKRDTVLRVWYQMMERTEEAAFKESQRTGRSIAQMYYLDDLDGFSIREQGCLMCTPIMYEMTRSFAVNHPEFIGKAILINVPRLFMPILSIVKNILPETQANAISEYGHNKEEWQAKVLQDIAPDQIPPSLGGTKTTK